MRTLFVAVTLLAVVFIAARGVSAEAAPACLPKAEHLELTLSDETFYNGERVMRSSTTGRYVTDAGVEFGQDAVRATVLHDPECRAPAKTVTLFYLDPWTGEERAISLARTDMVGSP